MNNLLSKPAFVAAVIIVICGGSAIYAYSATHRTPRYNFVMAKTADITSGATVTGNVQSAQAIDLSFQRAGRIEKINVDSGAQVKQGQLLASLDTSDVNAQISQAQASVETAQANLQKLMVGASGPEVDVAKAGVETAQVNLDNAKKSYDTTVAQQKILVTNAQSAMLNSGLSAIPESSNSATATATVSGTYTDTTQGTYTITVTLSGGGYTYNVSGLENYSGSIARGVPEPIGTKGLYVTFSQGTLDINDAWTVSIPNTLASTYLTNYNAYQAVLQTQTQSVTAAQEAIDSAQAAFDSAQANLQLKVSAARPEDIAAGQAALAAAQAQLQNAEVTLKNSSIFAPIDGTITAVDIKLGETSTPGKPAISMISNGYQIVAYLSENDLPNVKVGDNADVTLDAYGTGMHFNSTVYSVDPAETMINGIPTYKVVLIFTNPDDRIKSGLVANVSISDQNHQSVTTVPDSAIIKRGNQRFVLVDIGSGKTQEMQIQTGLNGLDGNDEVISGIQAGQRVVNFGN